MQEKQISLLSGISLFVHSLSCPVLLQQYYLLVVAKEDLDWEPAVTADLEAVWEVAQSLELLVGQLPAVKLEVALDSRLGDGLGDDTGTTLETPHEAVRSINDNAR